MLIAFTDDFAALVFNFIASRLGFYLMHFCFWNLLLIRDDFHDAVPAIVRS